MKSSSISQLRRDIEFDAELCGHDLHFHTTWGLFSPREIDDGTLLLLQHLDIKPEHDCLDLGCGYGSIGLAMARSANRGQTLLIDKDFVAVEYVEKNIRYNHINNAEVLLSNGFDHIPPNRQFDVIASNIPAKVGRELLTLILHDAYNRLNPGGCLYIVTINGLRQFMKRHMAETFNDYKKIKQGSHYTVARARKNQSG